jgi:hypothetical protein
LKPLPNGCLGIIIKINLTTNYQLLLNCNKVHRALPWARGLQQNSFFSARMQNNCTRETRKAANLAPHGKHGYSLGPAMHHYRCQNVYISTTANERIVDTLEFFPHNYQMPQLSSTDRVLMAAKDMTDALQNPHPKAPFASVGDNTIAALTNLAAIFKLKLHHAPSPATQPSPAKVAPRPISFPHQPNP